MHLMAMNPPKFLFSCDTCDAGDGRFTALCMDGIWLGCMQDRSQPLLNYTASCKPLPQTTRKLGHNRPVSHLFRIQQVGAELNHALFQRNYTRKTSVSVQAIRTAIHFLNPTLTPTVGTTTHGRYPKETEMLLYNDAIPENMKSQFQIWYFSLRTVLFQFIHTNVVISRLVRLLRGHREYLKPPKSKSTSSAIMVQVDEFSEDFFNSPNYIAYLTSCSLRKDLWSPDVQSS